MAETWWDGACWRDDDTASAPVAAPRARLDAAGHPVMVLPGSVRVARLAAALQGALGLALGGATFLQWHQQGPGGDGSDALLVVGAAQVLFSLGVIAAGALLGRLDERARIGLTCLEALNATAVMSLVLTPAVMVSLVLDALVVIALWMPEVSAAMAAARCPVATPDGPVLPRLRESPPRRAFHRTGHSSAVTA